MTQSDLARLNEADRRIQAVVADFGLETMPQEFDVIPAQKMLEIMAYRLPVNFSHWSFGRDYEMERTKHEHGYGVPYEVVFNSNPSRAYLMETNPFPIQVLVIAHVYAHNDFMKNNRHFQLTRRDMITSAAEAAQRFRRYEEDYGIDRVERLIDAGMAVQWNIDPDEAMHPESESDTRERLYGYEEKPPTAGAFDDLLPVTLEQSTEEKSELRRKTPPEPTVDLLGYILEHSPRGLCEWEKDILAVIRRQAQYFMPYRRTKIMNEGWATFWHEKIMQRLFTEKFLTAEEHGFFNLYNARVKAHNPRNINPYLLGHALFSDIEQRWDKGRFGPAFEESTNAQARATWDTAPGEGRQKIYQVRRTHMDWFFVDEFLTKDVVDRLNLYIYQERDRQTHYDTVIAETSWEDVKATLVRNLMNWGVPRIFVTDGDHEGSLGLYLTHAFEGLPLDEEYCRRTLTHVYELWRRPVILETAELSNGEPRPIYYRIDERGLAVRTD